MAYYHPDHRGSTEFVTDEGGEVVAHFSYLPFGGHKVGAKKSAKTAYLFAGKELDSSTALYYFGARYYDPVLGRFITPENVGASARDPQALNLYSYAMNNPMTLVDPSGHFAWFVPIIVGAVLGGTEAAIHHGNVLEGIATGAILGSFSGGAGAIAGGSVFGVQLAAQTIGGAAGGATNAALFGGDVGRSALLGGGFALAGTAIIPGDLGIFERTNSAWGGEANYLINSAVKGGFLGAAYGAATNQNIGLSAESGAIWGAAGAELTSVIGHAWGVITTGEAPRWENGAWNYSTNDRSGITIGNVVTGDAYYLERTRATAGLAKQQYSKWDHEIQGHIPQSEILGPAYLAVHGLSWLAGAGIGREASNAAIHTYGFTERSWNSKPDY